MIPDLRQEPVKNHAESSYFYQTGFSEKKGGYQVIINHLMLLHSTCDPGSIYGPALVLLLISPHFVIVPSSPYCNISMIRCYRSLPLSSTPGTAYPVGLFYHLLFLLPPLPSIFSSEVSFLHL